MDATNQENVNTTTGIDVAQQIEDLGKRRGKIGPDGKYVLSFTLQPQHSGPRLGKMRDIVPVPSKKNHTRKYKIRKRR